MKGDAKQATIMAYANRFGFDYTPKYPGDFPFREVADSVDLPTGHEITAHTKHWNHLFQKFDLAWREHERIRTSTRA